jgi:autotransporter-associated beta strand protein
MSAFRCAAAAGLLLAMTTVHGQSLSLYERVRFDISTTSDATSAHAIGSNPTAIAWNGTQLYAAGYNSSGATASVAITQILNPNAAPGLNVVPTFSDSFGILPTLSGRGYTGLALTSGKLAAAWDNGSNSPSAIQGFETATNGLLWNLSASGGTTANVGTSRGMSGIGVDPGYQGIASQGGGGFAWTLQGSGRRAENDAATGVPTYVLSGSSTPANPNSTLGMVLSSSSTLWRDMTFDPATGDVYTRNNNFVMMNVRTGSNSCIPGINTISGTTITTAANSVSQNIAFLDGITVQDAGSFSGSALIFNNRASNGFGQAWTDVIKVTTTGSTAVTQIPTNWKMLYEAAPANGSSLFDFGWDAASQTLAVMDYSNRKISIFDLTVDVQAVISGTQTAFLSGTTPLAKRGAGTLIVNQSGPIATNTVYVEEGTLQIGSGGTAGTIGAPVAVTVSLGANLVFDRSDDYGGAFANVIGGDGGVEVKQGWLRVTSANRYTGGTVISGGTLTLGDGGSVTGSTTVQAGVLQIANATALVSSPLTVVAGGTAQVAASLRTSVAGLDLSGNGLVDVTSGSMAVASGLSATDLVAEILEGRGDGTWTGTSGITSSVAAANVAQGTPRAVGWLDNGDGSVSFAFAAPGDTNLDWQVDVLDAANVIAAGKFNAGDPATWAQGDFNYDGVVNVLDAADFLTTGLYNQGFYNPPPAAVGAVAAVPEPTTWLLLAAGLTGVGVVGRRRTATRRA